MSYGGIIGQQPALEASGIAYNNSQTSSIITGDNVQTAIDQLFTSVSNGKNKIASAITDKGISTSPSDSFDVMAGNIGKIRSYNFSDIKNVCDHTGYGFQYVKDTIQVIRLSSASGKIYWSGSLRYSPYQCTNSIQGATVTVSLAPLYDSSISDYAGINLQYDLYGNMTYNAYTSGSDAPSKYSVSATGDYKLTTARVKWKSRFPANNPPYVDVEFTLNLLNLDSSFDITLPISWPVAK